MHQFQLLRGRSEENKEGQKLAMLLVQQGADQKASSAALGVVQLRAEADQGDQLDEGYDGGGEKGAP